MPKFDEHNSYTIQGWMLTEYNLKGTELLVYANIYSITQDGTHKFFGSLRYLSEGCGVSKQSVINALRSLVEAGYIIKDEFEDENGVRRASYVAVLPGKNSGQGGQNSLPGWSKNLTGVVKNLDRGSQKFRPKYKSNNNSNNNSNIQQQQDARAREDLPEETETVDTEVQRVVKAYQTQIGSIPNGKAWELLTSYVDDLGADAAIAAIEETNLQQPNAPWAWLKKMLDGFADADVHDRDSALAHIADHRRASSARTTAPRASPEKTGHDRFNYQQHTYTEADFADLYYDPAKDYGKGDGS